MLTLKLTTGRFLLLFSDGVPQQTQINSKNINETREAYQKFIRKDCIPLEPADKKAKYQFTFLPGSRDHNITQTKIPHNHYIMVKGKNNCDSMQQAHSNTPAPKIAQNISTTTINETIVITEEMFKIDKDRNITDLTNNRKRTYSNTQTR